MGVSEGLVGPRSLRSRGPTSRGYGVREISLASLEREGGTLSGLALLASQKWWFLVAKRVALVGGME